MKTRAFRSTLVGTSTLLAFLPGGCAESAPTPYDDVDVDGSPTNPEGIAYPTDYLGTAPRVASRAGSRINNFSFKGYLDSSREGGLQTISLAHFYDPTGVRYKVIQLAAMATWCSICASQAEASVSVHAPLAKRGVAFVEVMINGKDQSTGPALVEVEEWMTTHNTTFTVLIDAKARRTYPLGVYAVPWNALIDARTMEILDSGIGAPRDIVEYIASGLSFVETQPPSYPLP